MAKANKVNQEVEERAEIVGCEYHCYRAQCKGRQAILWNRPISQKEADELGIPTKLLEAQNWWKKGNNFRHKLHWKESVGTFHIDEGVDAMIKYGVSRWDGNHMGAEGKYHTKVMSAMRSEDFIVLDPQGNKIPWDSKLIEPFIKNIRNSGKNLVETVRPILFDWTAQCDVHVIDPRFKMHVIEAGFKLGGLYNGMGDYRRMFGKFDLVSIEEVTGDVEPII